ncbi:MAG: hypothetical protein II985_06410 [Alistipes sp.]|nr:hypothetical protein [Alistipes sp.]
MPPRKRGDMPLSALPKRVLRGCKQSSNAATRARRYAPERTTKEGA